MRYTLLDTAVWRGGVAKVERELGRAGTGVVNKLFRRWRFNDEGVAL